MSSTTVKLQKVGNSQAVIIPSKFLKSMDEATEVQMEIADNEIKLVFNSKKPLKRLIEEKRYRNKEVISKVMEQIQDMDLDETHKNYIISSPDDLID